MEDRVAVRTEARHDLGTSEGYLLTGEHKDAHEREPATPAVEGPVLALEFGHVLALLANELGKIF